VGLIAAVRPRVSAEQCSSCGACVDVCNEDAITLPADARTPVLDLTRCVACGQCVKACPTGALEQDASGYRLQLGGKLGRHPRLATELEGIYSKEEMLAILDTCLEHYKKHNRKGERFGEILNRTGLEFLDRHTRENQSSKKRDHV
jgi:dissimilatory sulfite reductase (desulfoviridin) alpha/beta subunit